LIYLLFLIAVFVVLGLALTLSAGQVSTPSSAAGPATVAPSAAKHVGPPDLYPNPSLTPGDVLPGVTAAEVCQPGYATSVRAVSSSEKAEVFRRYGIPDVAGKYEVDHFVSLEIGGSNNVTNLWPERYGPTPGAHEKDKVEDYLHTQVCHGAMSLPAAQNAIRQDWYAIYRRIVPS
jgi:hypothetical protein